jgi:hypothetical protein
MGQFLININDGTVCDLGGTVLMNTETLDEAGLALLQEWDECGKDYIASELGQKYGIPLDKYTDNDLTYANSIAFSVKALREEFTERLASGYDNDEYKFASELTDEQLEELGQYILSSDYLWNVYSVELTEGIRNYASDILGRSI